MGKRCLLKKEALLHRDIITDALCLHCNDEIEMPLIAIRDCRKVRELWHNSCMDGINAIHDTKVERLRVQGLLLETVGGRFCGPILKLDVTSHHLKLLKPMR